MVASGRGNEVENERLLYFVANFVESFHFQTALCYYFDLKD